MYLVENLLFIKIKFIKTILSVYYANKFFFSFIFLKYVIITITTVTACIIAGN